MSDEGSTDRGSSRDDQQLRSFQRYLKQARKILCVVGAGLSQSSGIPTYQLQRGTWKGYNSLDLATPEAFQSNPGLVWLFYSNRRYTAMKAKPNKGHFALAELSRKMTEHHKEILVVTQNVDGLQRRAGQPEDKLCELHGSVFDLRCTSFFCTYKGSNTNKFFLTPKLREFTPRDVGLKKRYRAEFAQFSKRSKRSKANSGEKIAEAKEIEESMSSSDFEPLPEIDVKCLPQCPKCHEGLLRPGVVWFGEPLPLLEMDKVDKFFVADTGNSDTQIDLVLVIGTSGKVWPAMGYVERCKQNGGKVAIFNTKIEDLDIVRKDKNSWAFEGEAAYWLPKALEPIIGKNIGSSTGRHQS